MPTNFRYLLLLGPVLAAAGLCLPEQILATTPSVGGFCVNCVSIRVGLPRVVRGPAPDMADNRFTEIALPDGGFRGFDAHGDTRAIDGTTPSDMGGAERTVLRPGAAGSYDSCGQWLNHAEAAGTKTIGFIHDET